MLCAHITNILLYSVHKMFHLSMKTAYLSIKTMQHNKLKLQTTQNKKNNEKRYPCTKHWQVDCFSLSTSSAKRCTLTNAQMSAN